MATVFSSKPDGPELWTEAHALLRCPYTGIELDCEPSSCLTRMNYWRDGYLLSTRKLTEDELHWIKSTNYQPRDMSGRMAQNKGKRGEREVYKLLQPIVDEVYTYNKLEPPVLQRNTLQSRAGGYDIVGLDWLALEVKYVEKTWDPKWWKQAVKQAGPDQTPVLFFRRNHGKWKIHLFTKLAIGDGRHVKVPSTITVDDFALWLRYHIHWRLQPSDD